MSKSKKFKTSGSARHQAGTPKTTIKTAPQKSATGKPFLSKLPQSFSFPILPVPIVVFILTWLWIVLWQGDVFRIVRENSFFAFNSTLMEFVMCKPFGFLWCIGRALLTTFRYPWLGGLVLSFLLTSSCWLLGYALRLKPYLRWIQYLPLGIFTFIFTYQGISNWFEAESGQVMGIPFCIFVILLIWGIIIRSFSRKHSPAIFKRPKDETPWVNRTQILAALATIVIPMIFGRIARPYVRPLAKMEVAVMNQDWQKVIDVANANAEMSNRPMAAYYAIALVQTGQLAENLFDIRLDYDEIYAKSANRTVATLKTEEGKDSIAEHRGDQTNIYQMECDYHAGLVQTAYHHAMESMAMEGPNIRNLKMLCKTSLMRGEWEVAEKYLTIISKIPFEGDFVKKYKPMLRNMDLVNADEEMSMVRLTEPTKDVIENNFIKPVFLGYNANGITTLEEARSETAFQNSMMVHLYTKTTKGFLERIIQLKDKNKVLPKTFNEALLLMSGKEPAIPNVFPRLTGNESLVDFLNNTRQYMSSPEDRADHALELFPKYKGYYPYYYFFGNLKATKKKPQQETKTDGVN